MTHARAVCHSPLRPHRAPSRSTRSHSVSLYSLSQCLALSRFHIESRSLSHQLPPGVFLFYHLALFRIHLTVCRATGLDPATGALAPGGITGEAPQAMNNVQAIIESVPGASMADVYECTVLMANLTEYAGDPILTSPSSRPHVLSLSVFFLTVVYALSPANCTHASRTLFALSTRTAHWHSSLKHHFLKGALIQSMLRHQPPCHIHRQQ